MVQFSNGLTEEPCFGGVIPFVQIPGRQLCANDSLGHIEEQSTVLYICAVIRCPDDGGHAYVGTVQCLAECDGMLDLIEVPGAFQNVIVADVKGSRAFLSTALGMDVGDWFIRQSPMPKNSQGLLA